MNILINKMNVGQLMNLITFGSLSCKQIYTWIFINIYFIDDWNYPNLPYISILKVKVDGK